MLIIWLKVRRFLELEKFGESANPCATERVKDQIVRLEVIFIVTFIITGDVYRNYI